MSNYFWYDEYSKDETLKKEMDKALLKLSDKYKDFAIYRFGLNGQEMHSSKETANHFSISLERVKSLESAILRSMGIRMPRKHSDLQDFLKQ